MPAQATYIRDHIAAFEDMLAAPDFADHYDNWITDIGGLFCSRKNSQKNVDGYRLSAYFYKNRDSEGGKYNARVDFNIAFGIGDYCGGSDYTGWAHQFNDVCPEDAWIIHFWWEQLWSDPAFSYLRVANRWQELRAGVWSDQKAIFGIIDSLRNLLNQSQERNFERWPISKYVFPMPLLAFFSFRNRLPAQLDRQSVMVVGWPNGYAGYEYRAVAPRLETLSIWLHPR
ncbi:MAG: CotH kinase family protein [Saprospiraceae bacterium]